jgi:hypothetical protein
MIFQSQESEVISYQKYLRIYYILIINKYFFYFKL